MENFGNLDQEIITYIEVYLHLQLWFHHITYLCAPYDVHVNLCFTPITTISKFVNFQNHDDAHFFFIWYS